MEREDSNQLELFSQARKDSQAKPKFSRAFLNLIWAYEKAILVIFSFIITGIVSFSLGVEKGKRLMTREANLRLDVALEKSAATPAPAPSQNINKQDNQQDNQAVIKRVAAIQPKLSSQKPLSIQNYTIQIASYRTKVNAQKEAERLKRKGYTAVILSKGTFSILCVGNFPKQESAKSLLAELKKLYQDSYIRRL